MDGSTVEHSDSDSGESWTLLENSPTYGDEAPDLLPENVQAPTASENVDLHSDKDEDTDGISIISDSEPESSPCDLNFVKVSTEESPAEQVQTPLLGPPPPSNDTVPVEQETDFLGDNIKYKTYVHRRNHKVGTILDVIMLGTFIITAGMALGHLWSCKNECTTQTSVNKILSNLYKLQEENAFLRSKLKEVTAAATYQRTQQQKPTSTMPDKQFRCKKIFEEPVMKNNKIDPAIKCVDDKKPDVILQDSHSIPEHEKELLKDIDKMKDIYGQNKDWLDKELERQFNEHYNKLTNTIMRAKQTQLDIEKELGPTYFPVKSNQPDLEPKNKGEPNEVKTRIQLNLHRPLNSLYEEALRTLHRNPRDDPKPITNSAAQFHEDMNSDMESGTTHHTSSQEPDNVQPGPIGQFPEKKITYADSLKTDQPLLRVKRNEHNVLPGRWNKEHVGKKKNKDDEVLLNLNSFSEDDIIKDDRYTGPKTKYEKKKHDRQKSHKKQKRNNKYEQWEMKGGYLKDFDEFSVTSSQDNDMSINKPEKKFLNTDFENYVNMLIEAENNASNEELPKTTKNINEGYNRPERRISKGVKRRRAKAKEFEWYDQRAALRAEARIKMEQELFGENPSNTAGWYFRRMQKREQCRAQKDNSTFKKFSKRKMNFKMKR